LVQNPVLYFIEIQLPDYLLLFHKFAYLFQTAAKHLNVSVLSLCWEFTVLTVDENAIVEPPQVPCIAIIFCETTLKNMLALFKVGVAMYFKCNS
jgi:hypothetical protein